MLAEEPALKKSAEQGVIATSMAAWCVLVLGVGRRQIGRHRAFSS